MVGIPWRFQNFLDITRPFFDPNQALHGSGYGLTLFLYVRSHPVTETVGQALAGMARIQKYYLTTACTLSGAPGTKWMTVTGPGSPGRGESFSNWAVRQSALNRLATFTSNS
jgi:hypothetical protein